ncbi:hypothetical protein HPB47_006160 [Ixodes persulcatus]|uniref:Uncharacterized protein n=1 Tax=Ixodes persulcatus TaxID=34615 RepID=A0AC60PB34_IXOPE|nr:hypothetical protein HPB47_006160 [Ixodes persulcatus]
MGASGSNYDAEPYQLANYGIGGQYLPHNDYLQDGLHANPDRLDAKMEHAVFRACAPATPDQDASRAGSRQPSRGKRVANKWFRFYSNVFRLPCCTDRNASMAPLV